jgi:hypothetical protein
MPAKLPSVTRRRSDSDPDPEIRRLYVEGATMRARILIDWATRRDARARQVEEEVSLPSAPDVPMGVNPENSAFIPLGLSSWQGEDAEFDPSEFDGDGYDEVEIESDPVAAIEPADAGRIAERLKGLNHAQLKQVAAAFSEEGDDAEGLRQSLLSYVDGCGNDAADDARGDPDAAREAGRREAVTFLSEEIDSAAAMPASEDDPDEEMAS